MKITMLMAISVNGYIAGENQDTDWVKDSEALYLKVAQVGAVIMGRVTYEDCVKYNVFPYKGGLNVVVTRQQKLIQKSNDEAIFTNLGPVDVKKMLEDKGFGNALLIGGGHINTSFLEAGLVDEIILDIHPLIIGQGTKLFENEFKNVNLELISNEIINDQIVQMIYKIRK